MRENKKKKMAEEKARFYHFFYKTHKLFPNDEALVNEANDEKI